jgi:major intracellular serine protease
MKGTSMACPFVSGALALLKNWFTAEFGRTPTESELYAQLIKCTMDLDMPKTVQGNGVLYLAIEDITDKLVFNENLINQILGDNEKR